MNEEREQLDDAQLDAMLRRHLRRELEPHVGKATAKLEPAVASRWTRGLRWSAAAALLVGTGVGLSLLAYGLQQRAAPSGDRLIAQATTRAQAPIDAIFTRWSETYDDGTVVLDDATPARVLRHVQYERKDWQDESGVWQSAIRVPQQDVIFVDLPTQ